MIMASTTCINLPLAPNAARGWRIHAALGRMCDPYRTAMGFPGEPVAPFSFSGEKMNANS